MFKSLLNHNERGNNQIMERPIKGGYILISLGLIALSASAELSLDYERITKTKKHIVLTGIKVGDDIMPDVCVEPQMTEDGILFSDVYGFDILVAEDNSVTVSEHQAPEDKGTEWYIHKLRQYVTGQVIFVITTYSESILVENTSNITPELGSDTSNYPYFINSKGTLFNDEIVIIRKAGASPTYNLATKSIDFTNSQITYTDITLGSEETIIKL